MPRILCGAAIFLCLATTAYAINCRVCQNENDPDCDSNFPSGSRHAVDCYLLPKDKTGCVITTFPKNGDGNMNAKLQQYCVWDVALNSLEYLDKTINSTALCQNYDKFVYKGDLKFLTCKVCPKNLCHHTVTNSAAAKAGITFFLILVTMLSSFI